MSETQSRKIVVSTGSIVSPGSTRVLIVAYRTAATPLLLAEVRDRARRSPCAFTLVVPRPYWDPDTEEATATLALAIPLLEEAADGHVEGLVGDTDPLVAVRDAIERFGFDEVIVSTLPARVSRWLRRDLPTRVRQLGLPVTVVTATHSRRREQRMFASIRHYRLIRGPMDELTRRVDEGFAEEIAAQPGFVSYEFLDCGDGEVMTISVFSGSDEAKASGDLAYRWTEEHLRDLAFTRIETLDGEIVVSRAAQEMLTPAHAGATGRFASVRRYRHGSGSVSDLMHVVDEQFAGRIEQMDGFEAYHALDCGGGEVISISVFHDQSGAEESDDRALEFVRDQLTPFDIERTDVIGGTIAVSRAMAPLLEPAHA